MDMVHLVSAYIMGSHIVYETVSLKIPSLNSINSIYFKNICKNTYQCVGASIITFYVKLRALQVNLELMSNGRSNEVLIHSCIYVRS